jgi:hypothetical protein
MSQRGLATQARVSFPPEFPAALHTPFRFFEKDDQVYFVFAKHNNTKTAISNF